MTQMTFGEVLRDDGAEAALRNAEEWAEAAWAALLELAASGEGFTSEDLRRRAGDAPVPNAVGGLFLRASRRRLIAKSGTYRRGTRPESHATELPVWKGTP